MRPRSKCGLAVAAVVVASMMTGRASAADSVTGCFTYQGAGVPGLTTALEYHTANGWQFLGAVSATRANGCIKYTLSGWWRNASVRIRAASQLSDGQTVASAATKYASPGSGSYALGTAALGFYRVPGQDVWNVTGTWLSDMAHPNCSSSSAMLVVCYMDAHGMVGNPIAFPDSDRDGVWDLADRWPENRNYH